MGEMGNWLNFSKVLDLFHPELQRFLNYDELCESYGTSMTFLQFCSLKAAIPRLWKQLIKHHSFDAPLDLETQIEILGKSTTPSKTIYWHIIQDRYPITLTNFYLWQKDLVSSWTEEEWLAPFTNFIKKCQTYQTSIFSVSRIAKGPHN